MKTILVVDDEENIRALFKEELEEEGYRVVLASRGDEALRLLEKKKPDLVVLDIRMPGMDGLEVLKRIRENDKNILVIMSTAYGEYRQDFHTWSSDAYVVKTSDLGELKATVRRLLVSPP